MSENEMKSQSLTVNQLPVLTWNHLKVNDSQIIVPEQLDLSIDEAEVKGLDESNVKKEVPADEPANITTGMGLMALNYVKDHTKSTVFYQISKNEVKKEPIVIRKTLRADWLDYIRIQADENASASFIFSYESLEHAKGLHGNAIILDLKQNAKVKIFIVQLLGQSYEHFTNIGGACEDGAEVEINYVGIGAKKFWVGCEIALLGRESKCKMETSYLGGLDKQMDFNLIARHLGKKTESEIKGYGVLAKNSKKLMRGTIDFIKGAKGAIGSETENVLMLSKEAENKSVPLILCAEDDVNGKHGASVGNINPQQLFYLNSRGISREEAHKMFAQSIVDKMKDSIDDEIIKEHLTEIGGTYLEQLI